MQEGVAFPKLPPGANVTFRFYDDGSLFEVESEDDLRLVFDPEDRVDRLYFGYTMAGQWEDELTKLSGDEDQDKWNDAYFYMRQWHKWARGEEWK